MRTLQMLCNCFVNALARVNNKPVRDIASAFLKMGITSKMGRIPLGRALEVASRLKLSIKNISIIKKKPYIWHAIIGNGIPISNIKVTEADCIGEPMSTAMALLYSSLIGGGTALGMGAMGKSSQKKAASQYEDYMNQLRESMKEKPWETERRGRMTALEQLLQPKVSERLGQTPEALYTAGGPLSQAYYQNVLTSTQAPGAAWQDTSKQETEKALQTTGEQMQRRGLYWSGLHGEASERVARDTATQNALNRYNAIQADLNRASALGTESQALGTGARGEAQGMLGYYAPGVMSAAGREAQLMPSYMQYGTAIPAYNYGIGGETQQQAGAGTADILQQIIAAIAKQRTSTGTPSTYSQILGSRTQPAWSQGLQFPTSTY